MIARGPHAKGHRPIPGGGYTSGLWGVAVRYIRNTDRASHVEVTASTGFPLAVVDLETVHDLEALKNARLMACAPRMAAALHDLEAWLEAEGHPASHPARSLIRDTLQTATNAPLFTL